MSRTHFFLVILWALFSNQAHAQFSPESVSANQSTYLEKTAWIYPDVKGNFSFDDVRSMPLNNWIKPNSEYHQLQKDHSQHWLRFNVTSDSDETITRYFSLTSHVDTVEIFVIYEDGEQFHTLSGSDFGWKDRPYQSSYQMVVVGVPLHAGMNHIFLRIHNYSDLNKQRLKLSRLELLTPERYRVQHLRVRNWSLVFIGILSGLFFLNILIYLFTKERGFRRHAFVIGATAVHIASVSGLFLELLFPNDARLERYFDFTSLAILAGVYLNYSRNYLDTAISLPRFDHIIKAILGAVFLPVVLMLVGLANAAFNTIFVLVFIGILVVTSAAFARLRQEQVLSPYFLISNIPLLLGYLIYLSLLLEVVNNQTLIFIAPMSGLVIRDIILSAGISQRISTLKQEALLNKVENERLIRQQENMRRIAEEQKNEKLENTVNDRTRELLSKMSELEQTKLTIQRQNEELSQLSKNQEQIFWSVSHELRTPLTLLKGNVELLKESIPENAKVQVVMDQSNRLEFLIDKLFTVFEMKVDSSSVKASWVEIPAWLDSQLVSFYELSKSKKVSFNVDYSASISRVELQMDKEKVGSIISKLLSNAFQFTNEGSVTLSLTYDNGQIKIIVDDTGLGIAPENQQEIFKPFVVLNAEEHNAGEHLGLGLYIVNQQLKALNGSIKVQSLQGTGSKFSVEIPANARTLYKSEVLPKTTARNTNGVVLPKLFIVDDYAQMRQYLADILSKKYDLQLFVNAQDVLAGLRHSTPDLIISDVMMPGLNGFELVDLLKENEQWNQIPIILLTALNTYNERLKGLRLGVEDYIAKPFESKVLKRKIDQLLALHQIRIKEMESKDDKELDKFFTDFDRIIQKRSVESGLSVADIARDLAVSERSLYRSVRKITGFSPHHYLKQYRLRNARLLLLEKSNLSIVDVADSVGYNNASYFSTEFKKEYGVLPSDVR